VRFVSAVLVLTLLVACSGDDDDGPRAASATRTTRPTTTTSESTTTAVACDLPPPKAADGTDAQVVATVGDVQLAIVDHGASVDVVSLFKGCDGAQVSLAGAPAALPIGGTVTHGDGMRCENGEYTVLSATSDDGQTYQAKTTTYRLDGTALVETDTDASTIEAQQDPDALRPYYELDC
jgi:hypothetical protein